MSDIEIVHEGSLREKALRSVGPDSEFHTATFVRVGKLHDNHVRVVGIHTGTQVYLHDVLGTSQWDAEATNRIGGLGAARDVPPTNDQVDAAIDQARAAIRRAGVNRSPDMPTITPPDWLQMAKDLAAKTGKTELAMLAVIADTIKRNRDASDSEQIKFHLGLDLAKVEAEIDAWVSGLRR